MKTLGLNRLNYATPAVLEVMNQLTPRHIVDTNVRLSNEDMADKHRVFERVRQLILKRYPT